ncbi:MAG: zinc-dependent alcohol dehydrogenase family protein [Gammaproteobacteria bacterium]|nr:zinc-dependent alcohol dehydrogenase family protein [Gammaproteobacteria bacterium]MBT8111066.1 zinc-dependent alcohol dehydrogenase family protein [Gammaproteobacteria bacterium]NND47983.1 zinc-dependent alcohol dehydrogenase family protein [Woeseiaceae bacterium]NNL45764.1 zinc-dependent alcohol dehydrogenase family protein [Woeseiaceae bacterium]
MRAMVLNSGAEFDKSGEPLVMTELPRPVPGVGEILIRVLACGVCHTELDEIEGRTPPRKFPVVPGHEIIGRVAEPGPECSRHKTGQRVGVGWIHSSSGSTDENISKDFVATGRDINGGYAEYVVVPEGYAYPIPAVFSDAEAAPLLCAGAVGHRSLRLTNITDGQILGLTGFGGSGHLVLQLARYLYPNGKVFVFARSETERAFAEELGANWTGDTGERPPQAPHAIIDTTPAWKPVLAALKQLRPGGRLVINAIRKEAADRHLMADISYEDHLWMEKEIKSVANVTHRDIEEFLPVAAEIPLRVEIQTYPLENANQALKDLRAGHVRGAKVLTISDGA